MQLRDMGKILAMELSRRNQQNPNYGLRVFARDLKLSPASLSLVMGDKREAGPKMIRHIGEALALSPSQTNSLLKQAGQVTSPLPGQEKFDESFSITEDDFRQLSDWKHIALLHLVEAPDFRLNPDYISRKLGVTKTEALLSINILKRLDLLEKNPNGKGHTLKKREIKFPNKKKNEYASRLQHQFLQKAQSSMQESSFEERDISSMTFVMSSDEIEYAKAKIQEFRRTLSDELERRFKERGGETAPRVYNLCVQLYPLDKKV